MTINNFADGVRSFFAWLISPIMYLLAPLILKNQPTK